MALSSPVLVLVLLAVVVALLSSPSPCSAQAWVANVTITSITSPQCTSVFPAAVNCTLPATLTIAADNLPSPDQNPSGYYYIRVRSLPYLDVGVWAWNTTGVATVVVVLSWPGIVVQAMGVPLEVSFGSLFATGSDSAVFRGLSVAYKPAPVLTSISGCPRSDVYGTYGCRPDTDVLVMQGTGLSWFGSLPSYTTLIGARRTTAFSVTVVNDSYALMLLNATYASLLLPPHYNETLLTLSFDLGYTNDTAAWPNWHFVSVPTNNRSISFVPLPPPIVSSIVLYSCEPAVPYPATTLVNYTDCKPGVSLVVVYGHYLYGNISIGNATVGYYQCASLYASATVSYCYLPFIPGSGPGARYDVVVNNEAGAVTFPGMVGYSAQPTLFSIDSCRDSGTVYAAYVFCKEGTTITLRGANFVSDPQLTITLSEYWDATELNCSSPTFVTSSTLTCVLPVLNSTELQRAFYGQYVYVTVYFPTAARNATNQLIAAVYAVPNAATVTQVTGCEVSNGPLSLSRCRLSSVLTITGTNLMNTSLVFGSQPYFYCALLPGTNTATSLQCQLPDTELTVDSSIEPDTPYALVLWTAFQLSNAFRISFTFDPLPPPPPPSSSSSTSAAVIVVAVVVPVVVVLLAVLGALLWRRHHLLKKQHSGSSSDDSFGSAIHSGLSSDSSTVVELK